ncbi:MAG: XdhC family protein [Rhodospirillales bacterium]|nr:XdhC family protein [Rhodospirillales bacterium]
MTPAILHALATARAAHRPVVLATQIAPPEAAGAQLLLPDPAAPSDLNSAASAALAADRSQTVRIAGRDWFLQVHNPPPRLIVVGAVHIAQALVPIADPVGFAVIIVDPRRSFASPERFPNVTLRTDWPDEALDALKPDTRSAVVTLTHDPKLDDPALDRALKSPAFYIGALGSKRTHAARLARLAALGHSQSSLARIHGPVGLSIEAVTAPEIALSIIAEIVAVRRGAMIGTRAAA